MKQIHYVATLQVKRVELEDGKPEVPTRQGYQQPTGTSSRKVGDVTTLTVKAITIELLKEKVAGHLALIDDDIRIVLEEDKQLRGRDNV